MKLTLYAIISQTAALRSSEVINDDLVEFDCDNSDFPDDVRGHIADRLFDDQIVCAGVVDDDGTVCPKVDNGVPCFLLVRGTKLKDLIEAVRRDQQEVEEYLASISAKKDSAV